MSDLSPTSLPGAQASLPRTVEERLLNLVNRWQEAFDQGRETDVTELCKDCPELVPEVKRRIDVLWMMDKLAKPNDTPRPEQTDGMTLQPPRLNVEATGPFMANVGRPATEKAVPADTEKAIQPLAHLLKVFAPAQGPEELGRLGDYAILKLLGEGGMGAVFIAEDPMLKRRVALKVMRPEVAVDPSARERFLREARSAARLQNDHIVPIFHVGKDKDSDVLFITMPLLQGETLEQRLKHGPALTLAEMMKVGREVSDGLAHAHSMNLIHRDIKPANLWLESVVHGSSSAAKESKTAALADAPPPAGDFRVKILDFGLARPMEGAEALTGTGAFLGSPGFMSPEQINGETLDERADLFSLGCVLYRVASGKPAFHAATLTALLLATAEQTPPWPHKVNTTLPLAFSQLIMRLLQKKPAARYRSARDLVEAFAILRLVWPS